MTDMPPAEAGATDNRLSLNPNAWGDEVKNWEDGKTYTITLTITQDSPGEYTVTDVKPAGGREEGEGETGEETTPPDSRDSGYPNPAVARMMRGTKR